MEAATTHTYKKNGDAEAWSEYTHKYTESVSWESSTSVVAASKITNKITSTYSGDYTQKYNMDYANGLKESYINGKGYSSKTKYLVWVSRQNQKVYVFSGSKQNWKLIKTFICGTGKDSTPTPTGVTYITYRGKGLESRHVFLQSRWCGSIRIPDTPSIRACTIRITTDSRTSALVSRFPPDVSACWIPILPICTRTFRTTVRWSSTDNRTLQNIRNNKKTQSAMDCVFAVCTVN